MSVVKDVDTTGFANEVMGGTGLVLVDFYSPTCPPCKMLAPVLDSIATKYAGRLRVVKVDVSRQQALAVQCGITSVPTLLFVRDGVLLDAVVGYQPQNALESQLETILADTVSSEQLRPAEET